MMNSLWRAMPAFLAVVLAMTITCLALVLVLGPSISAARALGYDGRTTRIVAVSRGEPAEQVRFSASLDRFVRQHRLSVAYTPSSGSRVVTVDDRAERFRRGDGAPLMTGLGKGGPQPAALLSSAVTTSGPASTLVPSGVTVRGGFRPDVQLDGQYPLLLLTAATTTYDSGVYLVAGLDRSSDGSLGTVFSEHAMQIVDLSVQEPASLWTGLSPPFGPLIAVFVGLAALAAYLVTRAYASLSRERLAIAAIIGALPRELGFLVLRHLLPRVVGGTVVGLAAGLAVALLVNNPVMSGAATAGALSLSAGTSVVVWAAICAAVSWSAARKEFRAVSR